MELHNSSLIEPYLPTDPLLAQAWVDCLRWSVTEPEIIAAFAAETGYIAMGTTPIERMIDEATGYNQECVRQYIQWFHINVWGQ